MIPILLCTVLISNVGLTAARAVDLTLPPMVFLPGFGASLFSATVDASAQLPEACQNASIPINQPFSVDLTVAKSQQCLNFLLQLNFDPMSGIYSSPPGVKITTNNFGSFQGIGENYWSFPKDLKKWGYEVGVNLFGAPYDYRLMSDYSLTACGFIGSMKSLIETAYEKAGQKRVILVGHSNGGPTMYTFLTSSQLSQEWKDKHLAAMVGLSGNFLGQFNVIGDFILRSSDDENSDIDTECGWEGDYGSLPWGDYSGTKDVVFVTTYAGTAQEKNYTPRLSDLVSLFQSVQRDDWVMRLQGMYGVRPNLTSAVAGELNFANTMDRSAHPLVDTYCLYGSELKTEYGYVFPGNIMAGKPTKVLSMKGDSDQDIVDNTFCSTWSLDARPEASRYRLEMEAFPKVHHMDMISDSAVLGKLHKIVDSYRVK